jgi:hypothetical protein
MIVRELIAKLKRLDPNSLVVLAADAEGNGFKPLAGERIEEGFFDAVTLGGDVWQAPAPGTKSCIVLWPED